MNPPEEWIGELHEEWSDPLKEQAELHSAMEQEFLQERDHEERERTETHGDH